MKSTVGFKRIQKHHKSSISWLSVSISELIIHRLFYFTGQTAPRQPVIQQEDMVVHKEEVPDVPEEDENNHPHNEVIIGGLQ